MLSLQISITNPKKVRNSDSGTEPAIRILTKYIRTPSQVYKDSMRGIWQKGFVEPL